MNEEKLRLFFKSNEVKIGEGKDFTTTPPIYYSSLHAAFRDYFHSSRDKMDIFHFIQVENFLSQKSLAFNLTGANFNIVSTILGFHRFMELLLKDILRRINPYLAVKFLEKEEEIFNFLDNNINADEIKTIEFSETLKRFKYAYKHYDTTTDIYNQHLKGYEFIKEKNNLFAITILAEWRNRIMHNGAALPNLFAFDYLVTQHLIPLMAQIIQAEKTQLQSYVPPYFETKTGIKIIEELLKIKFDFTDLDNTSEAKKLAYKWTKIQHLKEIGRVSYEHNWMLRANRSPYDNYPNPIGRAERFADAERINHEDFYSINKCICCDANALIVYRREVLDIVPQKTMISWLKCYNCDYTLKHNLGDPNIFGLTQVSLFPKS